VFVSNALQKLLQQYVDTDCANKALTTALIASQKQSAFSALTLSQLFARIYKQANVVGASSHSGRRTFITTLADNAVNVRVIQALARHSNLNTTMRYIDVTQTKLESAVEHFMI
jgi:integrase/recombinase XerD